MQQKIPPPLYTPMLLHLPGLDGMRGLAALAVLISHSARAGFLPETLAYGFGAVGVSAFYMLSGFLMMHFAVRHALNAKSLRRYAIARIGRILPLFYLALFVTTVLFIQSGYFFYEVRNWRRLVDNLLLIRGTDVLWSVPVEMHFYLLFPVLWRAQSRGYFALAAMLVLAVCACFIYVSNAQSSQFILPYWLHVFVIGAALRWLLDDGKRNRVPQKFNAFWMQAAAYTLFASLAFLPPKVRDFAFGWPVPFNYFDPYALVLMPFILWFAIGQVGPFRLFGIAPLRWLGTISYGLYLIHSPVIVIVKYFEVGSMFGPFMQFLIVLAVSSVAASITFYLFERPAQNALRNRYS